MAGFFDGEGCIGIYMRKAWTPQVTVSQYDTGPLDLFAEIAAPSDVTHMKSGVTNYVWYSRRAIPIIEALYPFLIVKKEEAELFLRWVEIVKQYKPGYPFSAEHRIEIGELAAGLKQVKQDRRDRKKRGI